MIAYAVFAAVTFATLTALSSDAPAQATCALRLGEVRASGGITFVKELSLDKSWSNKTMTQPDTFEIQGAGSTVDISGMSVIPNTTALDGSLAKPLGPLTPVGGALHLPPMVGRSVFLGAVGTDSAAISMRQGATAFGGFGQAFGGNAQWEWSWGRDRALRLAAFALDGSYRNFALYATQPGADEFGISTPGQDWAWTGSANPVKFVSEIAPTAPGLGVNTYSVTNRSQVNTTGHFFRYASSGQYYGGFDVGLAEDVTFDPTGTKIIGGIGANAAAMYGKSTMIRCPTRAQVDDLALVYGCGGAEYNLVNADRDYGFMTDLATGRPPTGMKLLVPESFRGAAQHVGFDISYGIGISRSGDLGASGDFVRTHAGILGIPDSISRGDGRFIYATGAIQQSIGTSTSPPTSATSPYAFAQAAGAWQRGLDFTQATLFDGAIRLADGQTISLSTDGNTRLFYEAGTGKIVFTRGGVRVAAIDGNGNMTIRGTLMQKGLP